MEKTKKAVEIRSPIVTLMGHVDHGKTTLLDTIRKANVVAGEHGGITQHIGAYQINFHNSQITFIDTPGHAAFEKMRSRGAEVADIVILVVAANEGVKPQTQEAIRHIKKAKRPIIVALTKIDLPNIDRDKVKRELQKEDIELEEFGGKVPVVEVSALNGKGIDDLLEMIQLLWQISPEPSLVQVPLEAVVVESFLDKNRGPVVTVIVKKGILKVSQKLVVDSESITVKALIDDQGGNLREAFPGKPVEILGFKGMLETGSVVQDFNVLKSSGPQVPATLSEIIAKSQKARDKFKIILKADVTGSLEAISSNLPEKILVISSAVGEINPADIAFAKVSHAPILAFNIKISPQVKTQAEREGVVLKHYNVIYDLLSEMEDVVESFEQAKQQQKVIGRAKIIAEFEVEGKKIAGAIVTSGKIKAGDKILLNGILGIKGVNFQVASLKKFKKNVDYVSQGQECGVGFVSDVDFKIGDVIESLG